MFLQYIYRPVLNVIYDKFTYKIPDKIKETAITLSFFMIFVIQFLSQYVLGYGVISRGLRDYIICAFLAITIILSVNKKLEILKWNKIIYVPYLITALMMLIAALDHDLGIAYKAFPLAMIVAFMCFYYVWGNRKDYFVLFSLVAKAAVMFSLIIFLVCIFKFPYYDSGFLGYTTDYSPFSINPNGVSKLFLPGLASAIYLIDISRNHYMKYIYALLSGGMVAIIVLTNSRAGLLCTVLILGVYIGYVVIRGLRNKDISKEIWKSFFKVILCMTLMAVVSIFILVLNSEKDKYEIQEARNKVESVPIEIRLENMTDKEKHIYQTKESVKDIIDSSEILSRLDEYTAGRITIWTVYCKNMSLKGGGESLFQSTEYAHNQYIELSYKAGALTGIVYFVLVVIIGCSILMGVKNETINKKDILYQIYIYTTYFVVTMLDTGVLPFERGYIFMFYIVISPLFIKPSKKRV